MARPDDTSTRADYHDVDDEGGPVHLRYRLAMVFVRHGDGWLLVHDQNTVAS